MLHPVEGEKWDTFKDGLGLGLFVLNKGDKETSMPVEDYSSSLNALSCSLM